MTTSQSISHTKEETQPRSCLRWSLSIDMICEYHCYGIKGLIHYAWDKQAERRLHYVHRRRIAGMLIDQDTTLALHLFDSKD